MDENVKIVREALERAGYKFIDELGLVRLPAEQDKPLNEFERRSLAWLGFTMDRDI